jgi:hypothetical protein
MINQIRRDVSKLPYTDPALKEQLIAIIDYIKYLESLMIKKEETKNAEDN